METDHCGLSPGVEMMSERMGDMVGIGLGGGLASAIDVKRRNNSIESMVTTPLENMFRWTDYGISGKWWLGCIRCELGVYLCSPGFRYAHVRRQSVKQTCLALVGDI
jgi:hypothetical protein